MFCKAWIPYVSQVKNSLAGRSCQIWSISGYLWTVTLALFLCLEAWKKTLNFTSSLILWPAHCICWGFPGESMMSFFIYNMLLNSIYMQFNKHSNSYEWLIFWLIQILKDIFTFLFNYGSLTLSNWTGKEQLFYWITSKHCLCWKSIRKLASYKIQLFAILVSLHIMVYQCFHQIWPRCICLCPFLVLLNTRVPDRSL